MENRFCDYIAQHQLFSRDEPILAGVSGGIDSLVLLHLLKQCGFRPVIAHCNFCLRGTESDGDAEFVARTAEKWQLPLHTVRFDTQEYAKARNLSIQMAARKLRYDWFDELCETYGYSKIAIAHNNDDTTETFFINLLRGTGLRGLTGIPLHNGRIVRPLLFASRKEIEAYARENGLSHREDSTNAQTKYLRNKIRHKIVPLFRGISPRFDTTMQENILRLGQAAELVRSLGERLWNDHVEKERGAEVLPLNIVSGYSPAGYLLYEMLRRYGFDYPTAKEIETAYAAGHTGRQFFSPSRRAVLDRGKLLLTPLPDRSATAVAEISAPESSAVFEETHYSCSLHDAPQKPFDTDSRTAWLDADELAFPLQIRLWRPGDRFRPLGMKQTKKVSDYLIDCKMPLPRKERQQVVLSGGEIVWLTGLRIDDRYKITDKTKKAVKITV